MTSIRAIRPTASGSAIHLQLPGYQPGKKPRPQSTRSMCGAFTHRAQPDASLSEAVTWRRNPPDSPLTWCRPCIGHAASHAGLTSLILATLAEQRPT